VFTFRRHLSNILTLRTGDENEKEKKSKEIKDTNSRFRLAK